MKAIIILYLIVINQIYSMVLSSETIPSYEKNDEESTELTLKGQFMKREYDSLAKLVPKYKRPSKFLFSSKIYSIL